MSTTQRDPGRVEPDVSGWAVGGIAFAGTVMVMIGAFQALEGLVALFNDEFFVVTRNYTFDLDVTAWGWIHLIIGIVDPRRPASACSPRSTWAGVTAILICDAERDLELLLHPVLPDLGAAPDRPERLGDLGADPPGRDQDLS